MNSPVHTLTHAQAVSELEALLDSRPDDDDVLGMINWRRANDARVDELQAWILMHQPEEEAAPKEPEPTPEPEEAQMTPRTAPSQEAMTALVKRVFDTTESANKAKTKDEFKRLQGQLHQLRFNLRRQCELNGVPVPELPDHPVNPFKPKPTPKAKAETQAQRPAGPYVPPTADDLRALLGTATVPPLPPAPAPPASTSTAHDRARRIRREFWALLAAIEDMDPREAAAIREDLRLIQALAEQAGELVDEVAA